ncbi:MAG: precorrin-6y C5,15-methyltransferase (decarboxylating) subunit CbiE [Actinomycetota bacterium]|nr:precorrin-6y C5,15-methyltransferase (decarboxylating) subunit CbiE [Actinomycetota bacterium]
MAVPAVCVVGIGADGWPSLSASAQQVLRDAEVIAGSERQLGLVAGQTGADMRPWPSPMMPAVAELVQTCRGKRLAVLASGDPMFFGIGTALVRLLAPQTVAILPSPSSVSLACARLGWPAEEIEVVSLVGRHAATLHPAVQPGRRLIVLVSGGDATRTAAALITARGYGASALTVLEQLGCPDERIVEGTAADPPHSNGDALVALAIDCAAYPAAPILPRSPGLPDTVYEHDGQLTKREVRAVSLAALAPVPGQLLWDVGAGSGSVGIEWMRTHPACRAIAVEPREDRRHRIVRNAEALGVPTLEVIAGSAPGALADLPRPDAVFVGGGVSVPGVLEACLAVLRPGGRLVANAVTIQSEAVLADWHERHGGTLTRIAVQHAQPVGRFTGWHPSMPVTQWSWRASGP